MNPGTTATTGDGDATASHHTGHTDTGDAAADDSRPRSGVSPGRPSTDDDSGDHLSGRAAAVVAHRAAATNGAASTNGAGLSPQTTDASDTEMPATEKPATEKPATEVPGSEKPGSEKPGSEKPGTTGTPAPPTATATASVNATPAAASDQGTDRRLAARIRSGFGAFRHLLARHWLLTTFLVIGLGLRLLVIFAYRPAFLYVDSVTIYLNHLPGANMPYANIPSPDPLGYNIVFLRPVLAIGNLILVVVLQHLLGLAMAVVTYAVLVRRGVWRWLAALATAPVLFDAYQLYVEHTVMSDTVFEALLVAAFAVLVWHRRPGWRAIIIAGLLLGLASTVRAVGAPLLAALLVYVLIRAKGWPAPWWRGKVALAAVLVAAFAVPLYGYHVHAKSQAAKFTATDTQTNVLYARVATFVDCSTLKIPAAERQLCPPEPLGQRRTPDYYAHSYTSPYATAKVPAGMSRNAFVNDFSKHAVAQQPFRLAGAVAVDAAKVFSWNHDNLSNPDAPTERWRFQTIYPVYPISVTLDTVRQTATEFGGGPPRYSPLAAETLRAYQLNFGYTPGPVIAGSLIVALAAVAGLTRRRRPPMRWAALLYLAGGVLVLLASDAYEFTWRYQLPGLVLIPAAGALGLAALLWRPRPPSFPEAIDSQAIEEFERAYGKQKLAPVTVVVAAYNEAANIGAVIDRIPRSTSDVRGEHPLRVDTIVVVDGGSDNTADVARAHGAYTVALGRNRGQGAALRLGYYLARTGGAELIVTTDADGQYDIGQLPALLEPLRDGSADFVTGSRRLGVDESRDQVRRTGVRVFAWLVTLLTGRKVTDTSFGFRAMRAGVTARVTLEQPQYQSSELLISILMQRMRVVEVPMTMHRRGGGKSKKGNNLRYGMRYAGVVFSTWSRETSARWRAANTKRSRRRNLTTNISAKAEK